MTFLESLRPYTDGNGLVAPTSVTPGTKRASDNGVLYTSQALILTDTGTLSNFTPLSNYLLALQSCIDSQHNLHRSPGDTTPDAPDDYIGILSMKVFSNYKIETPALQLRLCQPVLVYLWLKTQNVLFNKLRLLLSPLVCIIIAMSNLGTDKSVTSNRLLTWTICQALKKRGHLTAIGAYIWEWRQRRIYGNLSNLFAIYFEKGHPFIDRVKEI